MKKNGRFLGSSFDPVKEAQAWAAKIAPSVVPGCSVFVLGLGSGYHVTALCEACPNTPIIVIDGDEELAGEILKLWPTLKRADLVIEKDSGKLIGHGRFLDGLCGSYIIAKHGPSCQINHVYFSAVERLLLGRDKDSFITQLKARPELQPLIDMEAMKRVQEEAVSIKTLQRVFAPARFLSTERRLWKILEELVI